MRTVNNYIESIGRYVEYRVGQHAQENMELIATSRPEDLWFHIREKPSCHVVATLPPLPPHKQTYDKKELKKIAVQGAVICKQFSKYKSEHHVSVIYTPISNVVVVTEKVGSVLVDKFYTIVL
jgi:predicted ribosome quality control (RQC) complex YloA/Tae2 family protein